MDWLRCCSQVQPGNPYVLVVYLPPSWVLLSRGFKEEEYFGSELKWSSSFLRIILQPLQSFPIGDQLSFSLKHFFSAFLCYKQEKNKKGEGGKR